MLAAVLAVSCICLPASFAQTPPLEQKETQSEAKTEELRVIPYPAGLNTTLEGASSAPKEINHRFSIYFSKPDFYDMASTPDRILLSHYPTYQQTTEYTCGPAAGLTVLYYYGNRDYDEMGLAKEMKTQGYPIGTAPDNMVSFFRTLGWKVESSLDSPPFAAYEDFQKFVQDKLKQGIPIMVENVEWGGHWRVIIGYDTMGTESTLDDVLILADSYDTCDHWQDGYVVNNGEKFFSMWFDHSMLPEDQRNQPWIAACPLPASAPEQEMEPDAAPYITAYEQQTEIEGLLSKTETAAKTDQILLMVGHNLSLWNKTEDGSWKIALESYNGYGKNGFTGNKREGDGKTPVGAYPILYAFGLEENPGTSLEYKKITPNSYLSGERDATYNTWVESETALSNSEHLKDYAEYKYSLHIGHNSDPAEYGKGSAIFLHVKSHDRWATDGGLCVPEYVMRRILRMSHPGEYIIIVPTLEDISRY